MAVVVIYWNTVQIEIISDDSSDDGFPEEFDGYHPAFFEDRDGRFLRLLEYNIGAKGEGCLEMIGALKSRPSANHDLGEITIVDGYKKSVVLEKLRGLTLIGLLDHIRRKWFDPPYYSKHGGYS